MPGQGVGDTGWLERRTCWQSAATMTAASFGNSGIASKQQQRGSHAARPALPAPHILLMPACRQLLTGTSTMSRELPSGTAGIARYLVSGFLVSPPARITPLTVRLISSLDVQGALRAGQEGGGGAGRQVQEAPGKGNQGDPPTKGRRLRRRELRRTKGQKGGWGVGHTGGADSMVGQGCSWLGVLQPGG